MTAAQWLADMQAADQTIEIAPGYTIGDELSWLQVPPTPDGATFIDGEVWNNVGRDLRMWGYRRADTTERAPTVVFVHGGGWLGGHPLRYVRLAAHLASQGYACLMPEYRFASEAPWPSSLNDVFAATAWIKDNHHRLAVNPHAIAAVGDSAGGHMAAMLALTPQLISCAVLFFPLTDMSVPKGADHIHELVATVLGTTDADIMRQASPLHHISRTAAPILTATGADDDITPVGMIREFHDQLTQAGVENELHVYAGAGHGFDLHGPWTTELWGLVEQFLEANLYPITGQG